MTRVLLFCPTVKLQRDTFESIHGLQFDGTLDRMFTHDNPHGDGAAYNVLHNYQKAERIVKTEGYDYLLTFEDDILAPPDGLQKLIALDADIAYGVYCFRKGTPTINIAKPNGLYECYSLPPNIPAWREAWGSVIECAGLGLGFTLIKRDVFDVLTFHSASGFDVDSQMAIDAKRLGLRQMSDTSVICGHKRSDCTTIWPDRDGYKIFGKPEPLAQRDITAIRKIAFWDYDQRAVIIEAGETRPIDYEHAAVFVNRGLATYAAVSA